MFYLPNTQIDSVFDRVILSTMAAVCSAVPDTWFQACRPTLWTIDTVFSVGDVVRSGTPGFVYECLISGTSGSLEPSWGNGQDQEFIEGPDTLSWKTHANYALANTDLLPADFAITTVSEPYDGRLLTIAEKPGNVTHTTGTASHTAFFIEDIQELTYIAEAKTTVISDNVLTAGRTTVFQEATLLIKFPEIVV